MQIQNLKKSNNRLIISTSLFFLSIFASFLISYTAHLGSGYWLLKRPIAEGAHLMASDVELVKSDINSKVVGYLEEGDNPIGLMSTRNLRAGEFISKSDLSDKPKGAERMSLSLSIRAADIPSTLSIGEIVTLYQVQDAQGSAPSSPPVFVLSGVFIKDITRRSANFSSDLSLTISINRADVSTVLAATASGRVVVVSSRG